MSNEKIEDITTKAPSGNSKDQIEQQTQAEINIDEISKEEKVALDKVHQAEKQGEAKGQKAAQALMQQFSKQTP
jgi:hypothetical protein